MTLIRSRTGSNACWLSGTQNDPHLLCVKDMNQSTVHVRVIPVDGHLATLPPRPLAPSAIALWWPPLLITVPPPPTSTTATTYPTTMQPSRLLRVVPLLIGRWSLLPSILPLLPIVLLSLILLVLLLLVIRWRILLLLVMPPLPRRVLLLLLVSILLSLALPLLVLLRLLWLVLLVLHWPLLILPLLLLLWLPWWGLHPLPPTLLLLRLNAPTSFNLHRFLHLLLWPLIPSALCHEMCRQGLRTVLSPVPRLPTIPARTFW